MNATDSTQTQPGTAQNPTRTAQVPRAAAQNPGEPEDATGAQHAQTQAGSFSHLFALLRTPVLPAGETSANVRAHSAAKERPRARVPEASTVQDPVLASTVLNPTKLAEQELRSSSDPAAARREEPDPGAVRAPASTTGGNTAESRSGTAKAGQTSATVEKEPHGKQDRAAASGNSAALEHEHGTQVRPSVGGGGSQAGTQAAAVGVPTGSAGAGAVRSGASVSANAVHGVAVTKAASSKAFINKLAQAAVPARAQLQQKQVVDAAARGLGMAIKKGGGEVTLRLRPESLGQIRVELRLHDARVDATVEVQTTAARELLSDSLPHLRAALEAQGLTVDRMVVEPARATAAQDAQHAGAGTDARAATPDGSGQPQQQDQEARSALVARTSGGDRAGAGTEAQDNPPLWAIAPSAITTADGVWEWVA